MANGDLDCLIEVEVPEGRFLAAEDFSSFTRHEYSNHSKSVRKYFKGIGLPNNMGYFNTGVFKCARKTWRIISEEAFAFFKANTKACRFADQSALNAVMGDRRLIMSTRYNFQTAYSHWGVRKRLRPALYHFTASPKPWLNPCPPWGEFYPEYQKHESDRLSLKLPVKSITDAEVKAAIKFANKQKLMKISPLWLLYQMRKSAFWAVEAKAYLK